MAKACDQRGFSPSAALQQPTRTESGKSTRGRSTREKDERPRTRQKSNRELSRGLNPTLPPRPLCSAPHSHSHNHAHTTSADMSALSFLDGPRAQWHDALTRVALYGGPEFKESGRGVVSALAFVLGLTCMFGLSLAFSSSGLWDFGWYLAFLSFFHFSEFVLVALFNPRDLTANCTLDSWCQYGARIHPAITEPFD